jgi:hypothetical protein
MLSTVREGGRLVIGEEARAWVGALGKPGVGAIAPMGKGEIRFVISILYSDIMVGTNSPRKK